MLKFDFGISDAASGWIMSLDNIFALFLLPLFGAFSDKVKTPIGRRMPFILVGTGAAFVLLLLLPFADQTMNLTLFVVVLFFLLIKALL